jgi:hypothetical protein
MAKIKHYIDKDTGEIVRKVKHGNRVEYETISQEQLENYEAKKNIFGCIGYVIMFVLIVKFFIL